MKLLDLARTLRDQTLPLTTPVGDACFALNPLDYAWAPHEQYVRRYGRDQVDAVWLGMNPGPWGMAQTGIPFGSVPWVKGFLGIDAPVRQPEATHPKRPIQGLDCERVEVSGKRVWGTIEEALGTPEAFFDRFWIVNYCPVVWQKATGANLPPNKLPASDTAALFAACDTHLAETVRALNPRTVIGVGAWAETKARAVVDEYGLEVEVARVLHPSPASPAANRGWAEAAHRQLEAIGHPLRLR